LITALRGLSLDPETAVSERVAPLLHHASAGAGSPVLKKAYYDSAGRNVALFAALDEARAALAGAGIAPVAIKGADLATSLYPNVAVRPMNDLDLWVEPVEVDRAGEVLASLGYRPAQPEMTEGLTRAVKHARLWVRCEDAGAIDLHWSLVGGDADRRTPSLGWFRARARGGRLDPTAHLLYLSAHMNLQHYDEKIPLLWLCDVYLLARDPRIEWGSLFSAARSFGWEAALGATCDDTRTRLRAALPPALESLSRGRAPLPLPRAKGGVVRALNDLATLDWKGRARLVRAYLLPSPAYVRWRYRPRPSWLWPLCYLRRWSDLVAGLIGLLARGRGTRPLLDGEDVCNN
jgi:hypothetical protein